MSNNRTMHHLHAMCLPTFHAASRTATDASGGGVYSGRLLFRWLVRSVVSICAKEASFASSADWSSKAR